MRRLSLLSLAGVMLLALASSDVALAEDASDASGGELGHVPEIAHQDWSFDPPFGHYDNAQLQRGFEVYRRICAGCHSMRLLSYRNLGDPGGPEFSPKAVEAIAAGVQITDGPDDKGQMFQRPGRPSDHFRSPFPNDEAARVANRGALPPDLSVIAKAREGGPDYIYALLTGYADPPQGFQLAPGMHYNKAFPGHQIAMPPPLIADDLVAYADGTPRTVNQYARDVSAFLMWAAEPKLEQRYKLGLRVMIYLAVLAIILYLAKRSVWAPLHRHRKPAHEA
jgi:cytochrome c1